MSNRSRATGGPTRPAEHPVDRALAEVLTAEVVVASVQRRVCFSFSRSHVR
jgi:hypothetical protein